MAEYIDITPIKEQIAHVKRNVKSENSDYLIGYISALSAVEGMIASLPATDVEPVKHGHWSRKISYNIFGSCIGSMMICSECNKDNKYGKCMGYCPNCGAKMDGKEVQE